MAATGNEFVSLSQLKKYMDNKLCPVNSLSLRIDDTSPASIYGGVWERLEEGFLYSSPLWFDWNVHLWHRWLGYWSYREDCG